MLPAEFIVPDYYEFSVTSVTTNQPALAEALDDNGDVIWESIVFGDDTVVLPDEFSKKIKSWRFTPAN